MQKDWAAALDYFVKAKDLYAMGRCYRELGDFKEAASCFERAAEIFRLLGQPDMAKKAQSQADSARGE